jgi:TolA-binding protein
MSGIARGYHPCTTAAIVLVPLKPRRLATVPAISYLPLPAALDYSPVMNAVARLVVIWLAMLAGTVSLCAATVAEKKSFDAAVLSFRGGWWERADRELGEFIQNNPKSDLIPNAVLFQAQSRIRQENFVGAIQLLDVNMAAAGSLSDEYLFWLAEAYSQKGDFRQAADGYSRLVSQFPASQRLLEAVVGEAYVLSRLEEWPRVITLLQGPEGGFRRLAAAQPSAPAVISGSLLLAEALQRGGDLAGAELTLSQVPREKLEPQLAWRYDHLLAQIQLGAKNFQQALSTSSNLVLLGSKQPAMTAEGFVLQARSLEGLGRLDDAIVAWQQNLSSEAPVERQREASLRVADLQLAQGRVEEAMRTMESFLEKAPDSTVADVAWLKVGELRLRQVATANAGTNNLADSSATNGLARALEAFDTMLARFPGSPLAGRAHVGRGWCLWLGGQFKESASAFQAAVAVLPPSYEREVARYKLGDAFFVTRDYQGALVNYQAVAANEAGLPQVRSNLVERALFQVVQCARETGNGAAARDAMGRLLTDFPEGSMTGPGLLSFGDTAGMANEPAARRAVLQGFLATAPDAKLVPAVRLAIARSYEEERNWGKAGEEYSTWLTAYPDDPAQPRAQYFRALASWRAGDETNSLAQFTDFLRAFPTNDLAPLARWWMGDHFWRIGDYVNAERNYQMLVKDYPDSGLRHEAQLMAARAAVARQRPEDAVNYLTNLTSDLKCPPEIQAQAMFAYGDTLMSLPPEGTNSALANYQEAIRIFSKLSQLFPDSRIALLAQGKVGSCYLQLGTADPRQYEFSMQAYSKVLMAPTADVATRSEAEVGLGVALEKSAGSAAESGQSALAKRALDHYLNVVYATNLRAGEQPSPFWVKRAGLEACRVAETLQEWDQLARLCDTLSEMLPQMHSLFEKKKARALEQAGKSGQ